MKFAYIFPSPVTSVKLNRKLALRIIDSARNKLRPLLKSIYYLCKQLLYFLLIAQPLYCFLGCSPADHSPSGFLGNSARDWVKLLSRPVAAIGILRDLSHMYLILGYKKVLIYLLLILNIFLTGKLRQEIVSNAYITIILYSTLYTVN